MKHGQRRHQAPSSGCKGLRHVAVPVAEGGNRPGAPHGTAASRQDVPRPAETAPASDAGNGRKGDFATWTVLGGDASQGWASDLSCSDQPRDQYAPFPLLKYLNRFRDKRWRNATPQSRPLPTLWRRRGSYVRCVVFLRCAGQPYSEIHCAESGQTRTASPASTVLGARGYKTRKRPRNVEDEPKARIRPRYDDSFETTLQARSRGVESVRYTPSS
ncbi:hypothetical protein HPB47_004066 [Ixodes persulcatus]|uniref:Uncharacterized protein n=1 Tax=Ixodes persulcatus TaxID=34615 RepID=A0AC60PID2_IXOPE|nr:hypothetical protein HPB47_004066 [Ixodes persulcatus]